MVIHLDTSNIAGATTLYIGEEKEPVVIIDKFSNNIDMIIEAGLKAEYQKSESAYPGLRAPANPNYLKLRDAMMFKIFSTIFGLSKHIKCENAAYSLVTTPRNALTPQQCLPHIDDVAPNVLAIMHYLRGPETGGTAFYRHRRTGFETLTIDRYEKYQEAMREDDEDFGPPAQNYIGGHTERYEMIEKIDAKPDRLILYRGYLLHSGWISQTLPLSTDPADGRLTVNMFLKGY